MKRAKKSFWFIAGILLLLGFVFGKMFWLRVLRVFLLFRKPESEKLYHRTLLLTADMILPR